MSDEQAIAKVNGWTVKGIPMEARKDFNDAADRADKTLGQWLQEAGYMAIRLEREGPPAPGQQLLPPEAARPAAQDAHRAHLEVVERLSAHLPALATGAKGGGAEAKLARACIRQHIEALLLGPVGKPAGLPRMPGGNTAE